MKLLTNFKKNKKGFTLIEMIVVIVIIGILLAILIPGMFKYIDKAKDKQIEVNARTAYLNMSTAIAELYGKNGVTADEVRTAIGTNEFGIGGSKTMRLAVADKGEVTIEAFPNTNSTVKSVKLILPSDSNSNNKFEIVEMRYEEGKKYIEMKNGKWNEVGTEKDQA